MIITREYAMPSRWTFKIKPIARLIHKYVADGSGWIDPFAGENSPAEITNDLNPDRPTNFHLHANDFVSQLAGRYNGIILDPPYSRRQTKECYESVGLDFTQGDSQDVSNWNRIKDVMKDKILPGGYAMCFGWNTCGFGKGRGFEMVEILIVNHGGGHHDTLCTVERKFRNDLFS